MTIHPRFHHHPGFPRVLANAARFRPPGIAQRPDRAQATSRLHALPGNPVPGRPGPAIVPAGGIGLRTVVWRQPGASRGTVLLLLGRGDFIEKYFEVAGDLLARGYAVASFDWRGQGGSERLLADPLRGHVHRFEDYGTDLASAARWLLPSLPRPWFGLAHSMGAAVLLHALARDPAFLDRAVLTAPMLALSPQLEPRGARMVAYALDRLGLAGVSVPGPIRRARQAADFVADNLLTSDPVRFMRSYDVLAAAPHLGIGRPTIGWLRAAYDGMRPLADSTIARALRTPVLLVAGGRDRVTDTRSAVAFAGRSPWASSVVVAGAAHDLMMECDVMRAAVWEAFDAFIPGGRSSPR